MGNHGSATRSNTIRARQGRYPTYEDPEERTYGPTPREPLFPWQFVTKSQREQRKRLRKRAAKRRKRDGEGDCPSEVARPLRYAIPPEDGKCYFKKIPREILVHILQYVGEETLSTACPLVNRQFNDAAEDENLWRYLYLVEVGRAPSLLGPPDKYSNTKWHRQAITSRQEYYYRLWRWYESYGCGINDVREERFPDITKRWLADSSLIPSRTAFLDSIHEFDRSGMRHVYSSRDRSAPVLRALF